MKDETPVYVQRSHLHCVLVASADAVAEDDVRAAEASAVPHIDDPLDLGSTLDHEEASAEACKDSSFKGHEGGIFNRVAALGQKICPPESFAAIS
eukprot:28364-Amphidinium_carterae.1